MTEEKELTVNELIKKIEAENSDSIFEEYYSCEYIEEGINFYYNNLLMICCYNDFIGEEGIIADLSKEKVTSEMIIKKKIEIINRRRNNQHNGCINCSIFKRKKWRDNWTFILRSITLNHYLACNLRCAHCGYVKYMNKESDTPYQLVLDTIKELENSEIIKENLSVDVGGGEPSYNKGIDVILEHSLKKKYNIHINSNGSYFNMLYIKGIKENLLSLTLTPDAAKKETYKIIKGKDFFDKVWENIGKYSSLTNGNIRVKLIMQNNNFNEIKEFVELCEINKINRAIIDIDINLLKSKIPEIFYKVLYETIIYSQKIGYSFQLGPHWPGDTMEHLNKLQDKIKYCCLCESDVEDFLPYNIEIQPFGAELEGIGSDVNNFSCPKCSCHDRERHLWLYINEIGLYSNINNHRILYFAPERVLFNKFLLKTKNIIVGDINPSRYQDRGVPVYNIDIENIPIEDNTFDLVIANHILEHVKDYLKAMREIKRVLRVGGYAILQTPYSPVIYNNFEDPLINTDELRLKFYGQEDHLRQFGLRFFDDLASVGFQVHRLSHKNVLSNYDPVKYGVNVREDLILVAKQDNNTKSKEH